MFPILHGIVSQGVAHFPLLDGLVDYFSFDLASDGLTGLHDSITFTNTGCTAGTGHVYPSAVDITDTGAYRLESTDARLKSLTTPVNSFEIAVWINYRTFYATKPPYRTIVKNGNGFRGFEIKGAGDSQQTAFIVGKALPGNFYSVVHSPAGQATNEWFLGHFQFEAGTTSRLGAASNGGALTYTSPETGVPATATAPFWIGWNGLNDHMDGQIGPLAVWNRTLTADERTWLYNSGNGRTYAAIAAYTG